MSFERKTQTASNMGYPTTAYNGTVSEELGYKGSTAGSGSGEVYEFVSEYVIDFANQPASYTSVDDPSVTTLPAGSVPRSATVQVLEAVSGGTNFNVGFSQPDGTVIDADGLVVASTISAVNAFNDGVGALLGTSLAADAQLTVSGTRTAGKIKVLVKYLKAKGA